MHDTRQTTLEASKRVLEKLQDISRSLPRRPCLFGHRCMIRLWKRGAHSALPKSPFSPSAPARCGTELIPTSIQDDVARFGGLYEAYMQGKRAPPTACSSDITHYGRVAVQPSFCVRLLSTTGARVGNTWGLYRQISSFVPWQWTLFSS